MLADYSIPEKISKVVEESFLLATQKNVKGQSQLTCKVHTDIGEKRTGKATEG
jgi:hypothetical protein